MLELGDVDASGQATRLHVVATSTHPRRFDPVATGLVVDVGGLYFEEDVLHAVLPPGERWTRTADGWSFRSEDDGGQLAVGVADDGPLTWRIDAVRGRYRLPRVEGPVAQHRGAAEHAGRAPRRGRGDAFPARRCVRVQTRCRRRHRVPGTGSADALRGGCGGGSRPRDALCRRAGRTRSAYVLRDARAVLLRKLPGHRDRHVARRCPVHADGHDVGLPGRDDASRQQPSAWLPLEQRDAAGRFAVRVLVAVRDRVAS